MDTDLRDTFGLRYVGTRFNGGRIPLVVLPDLTAFRDLIIAIAKENWFSAHPGRIRLPRGFNQSVYFDLVGITDASAGPQLQWDRKAAVQNSPDSVEEISRLVSSAFSEVAKLFDDAANDNFPTSLPADQISALNRFGSALLEGERVEFVGKTDRFGDVVFFDQDRRRKIITKVGVTYDKQFVGSGQLVTSSSEGFIVVSTYEYGKIQIPVDANIVRSHYDGNLDSEVQFDVSMQLDSSNKYQRVIECHDVSIVDGSDSFEFREAMEQILELRKLSAGWLDGSGEAVTQAAVKSARSVLDQRPMIATQLNVFPTEEGGISLEFVLRGWDFSVDLLPNGSVQFYGVELSGKSKVKPVSFSRVGPELFGLMDEWMGVNKRDGS